jgi:hypothetical protein
MRGQRIEGRIIITEESNQPPENDHRPSIQLPIPSYEEKGKIEEKEKDLIIIDMWSDE